MYYASVELQVKLLGITNIVVFFKAVNSTIQLFVNFQVTLNMLNAQESEMDVDNLGSNVKLEFESSTEEVTT